MTVSADDLDDLEESLKKLKTAYEKYFAGVERLEPAKERAGFRKTLRRLLSQGNNHNTARRFRLQTLQASLITHEAYWDRITRQIEEGTYQRDLFRMRHRMAEKEEEAPKKPAVEEDGEDVSFDDARPAPAKPQMASATAASASAAPAARPAPPPPLPARAKATPAAPSAAASAPPRAPGNEMRRLYDALVMARKQTGDSRPLTFETLCATVEKQTALLKERYHCAKVEFGVSIKDGKAILKAAPK